MPIHDRHDEMGASQAYKPAAPAFKPEDSPDMRSVERLSPQSKVLPRSMSLHSTMRSGGSWCGDGRSHSSLSAQEALAGAAANQAALKELANALSSNTSVLCSLEARVGDLARAVSNLQYTRAEQHQGTAFEEGSTLQDRMSRVYMRLHSLEARVSLGPNAVCFEPATPRRTLDSQPSVLGTSHVPCAHVPAGLSTRTSAALAKHMSSGCFDVTSIISASSLAQPADPANDAEANAGRKVQEELLDLQPRSSIVEAKNSVVQLLSIPANHSNGIEPRHDGGPGAKASAHIDNDCFANGRVLGTV